MPKKKVAAPVAVEVFGVSVSLEFIVREGEKIVDRGQVTAPPLHSPSDARRWMASAERELLARVRAARA